MLIAHINEMDSHTLLAWSTPIATLALLAVTIAYSYFTYQLAEIGTRQRFETVRPRLQIAVVATQRGQFFVLRMENVGISAARNFKVTIDRHLYRNYGDGLLINDMPIFRNGLPAFMPHTPVDIGLGVSQVYLAPDVDRSKHPARFVVTASYDFKWRRFEEDFELEVFDLYAETMITHTEMSDLTKALREDVAKPIVDALKRLKSN